MLVPETLYTLSDEQTEYQLKNRLSFTRFVALALHDAVPDAKTIWALSPAVGVRRPGGTAVCPV